MFAGSSTTGIAANLANRRFLGIDQEEAFLKISQNRKLEIEDVATAQLFRNRIAGFIDKKQFSLFIENESPPTDVKVALGFCRAKDIKTLDDSKTFYFHAIEQDNTVKDFPTGILDATRLLIYSGGRGKPIRLTGHSAEIKSIELKHKSKIKGKEKSETEFYYEIVLEDNFKLSEELKSTLNPKKLFNKKDEKNFKLLQQFLPAVTTWENLVKSIKIT